MKKKKNNTWLIVLLVIIILGLAGYIVYDKVLSKGSKKENNIEIKEEHNTDMDDANNDNTVNHNNASDDNNDGSSRVAVNESKYSSVISEYSKAMKDDNFVDDNDSETKYPNINYTMIAYYHMYNSVIFNYTYYDINKDGKDELIVGNAEDSIYEVYTYDGNKAVRFLDSNCLGDRCSAELWDNGIIYFEGSGGAYIHGLDFYKIADDGYSRKIVSSYEVEYDEDKNVTITDNKTNKKTNYSTDEQVISDVKGNANTMDLSKLDWKEIK